MKSLLWFAAPILLTISCTTVDVFEKNVAVPGHSWESGFQPNISFEITDTTALYHVYVVLRHTEKYRYNNIWLNLYIDIPGDTFRKQQLDLRLATDEKGWLGSAMDDIYEHRIRITREPRKFPERGTYNFRLQQIMRDDPLSYVMNVGIRVEKVGPSALASGL